MSKFAQVFQTEDGVVHATKALAERHTRKPLIMAALLALCGGQKDLADAIYNKEEELQQAFESGKVRFVSKAERAELAKSLAAAKAVLPADNFLVKYSEEIEGSFKWPTAKRATEEEQKAAAFEAVDALFERAEGVAAWIVNEKDRILDAFKAGVEKRVVTDQAKQGLALYRAMMDAKKALNAAREAFEKDATPENQAAVDAADQAFQEAEAALQKSKAETEAAKKAAKSAADAK